MHVCYRIIILLLNIDFTWWYQCFLLFIVFYYITVSVVSFTITVLKIFEALKDFILSRHHFVIEMAELFLGI